MTRRNVFLLTSLSLGATLLALLAGFVPQREGPEVRRRVSGFVACPRPEDSPAPIVQLGGGERLWAIRGPVAQSAAPPSPSTPAVKQHKRIIVFSPEGVFLQTGGVAPGSEGALLTDFAPLLELDGLSMPLLLAGQPRHYGDALDTLGRPLRWLAAAPVLAGYAPLGARSVRRRFGTEREAREGDTGFTEDGDRLLARAGRYRQLVESFAQRYNLNVDLLYAIIYSESNFSTTLVSHKSAMGLMQVVPDTANGEVHRYLYGRSGDVGFEELSVPETNLRYGVTYLHILFSRYFPGVRDPLSREYCTVAAYNMGPNRFLRLYGKSPEEAVERINAMSADALYEDLTERLPIRETRFYVAKVQRMKERYAALR